MNVWLRLGAVAAGCVALGVGIALVLLVELLHTPPSHTVEALKYLVSSAIVSLAVGAAVLLGLSRFLPNLALKIGVASTFASVAAILIVLFTPWMMFTSRNDLYLLLITLIYFVTISIAFAYIIATATTRQLRALHEGAIRVASGEFGAKVDVQGADEVADLAQAFNRMSLELGRHFERERQLEKARRDLIASVSHDLRTPLASIRAMVEAINDGVVSDQETVGRYLGLIQQETQRLGQLIEDLFELSRIESGSLELRLASVPITELVTEAVEGLRIQAEEKGVELEAVCRTDVPVLPLDGPRIQRALVNLIQNAVRHTPPGGQVHVDVGRENGHVRVAVVDTGEGIAPEDQPHVFDQFYRGEKSRSRGSGGAGLGLAIARGIIEAHRGSIRVESSPGKGSRFVVTL
jgi:signal transduction histidine kinase